ncbi:MAG: hypothetical protein PHW82_11875 [Bacteroidales bacterium]|nr:hypothetical protein [Bacteroidales bacterium]
MKKQFAVDYQNVLDYNGTVALQTEEFITQTTFDALNRPISITQPDSTVITNFYNKGGLLEKVKQGSTEYISNIEYNARGQRTDIYYGNGSKTAYTYDTENFRLTRLLTTKNSGQVTLQDLNYTYDSVGNIVQVEDNAQQTVYFDNSVIDPISTYEYDALYRLIEATGREKGGLNSAPSKADLAIVSPVPFDNQSNDVSNYTQTFEYDKLGNILNMSSQNKWSRDYFYDTATNRLLKHDEYGQNEYTYDTHGNMLTMPGISEMGWDFGDRLNKTISGTVTSYYNYDSGGERTRKVVVKQGGIREERYYISGYEVYRKFISDVIETERQTLHIADDRKRFAIIDTLTVEYGVTLGTPDVTIRYQYDNHLGSASLELDESANVISYEEYHPFGTSSYRLGTTEAEVSLKRYRYVGKEQDEETGLYYYGARYYAGWLCRFVSVDPLQHKYPYYTPYQYAGNKPITYIDLDGLEEAEPNIEKGIAFVSPEMYQQMTENGEINNENWIIRSGTTYEDAYDQVMELISEENIRIGAIFLYMHGTSDNNTSQIPGGPDVNYKCGSYEMANAHTNCGGIWILNNDLVLFDEFMDIGEVEFRRKYAGGWVDSWISNEAKYINDLTKLANTISDDGALIIAACNVGNSNDFLELLFTTINSNVNIFASKVGVREPYSEKATGGKTILDVDFIHMDEQKGWVVIGPVSGEKVTGIENINEYNSFRLFLHANGELFNFSK